MVHLGVHRGGYRAHPLHFFLACVRTHSGSMFEVVTHALLSSLQRATHDVVRHFRAFEEHQHCRSLYSLDASHLERIRVPLVSNRCPQLGIAEVGVDPADDCLACVNCPRRPNMLPRRTCIRLRVSAKWPRGHTRASSPAYDENVLSSIGADDVFVRVFVHFVRS